MRRGGHSRGARFAGWTDCQIVGSALHMGLPLATRDGRIIDHAKALGLEVVEI